MAKSLLLITESFPPVNNIAAQRFPPMLKVLEDHGWTVWVLTKAGEGPLPCAWPEARVIRIGRHHQQSLTIRADSHFARGSGPRRLARRLLHGSGLTLRTVDGSLLTWRRAVLRELPRIRARLPAIDLVLGTYGPPAALWLARRLAGAYQAPWIADFRDPAAVRDDDRPVHARWLDRMIETGLLHSAAALTTCGERWAAMLEQAYGHPVGVVYNGWDPIVVDAAPPPGDLPDGPVLHFAGRFYERQLEAVFRLLEAVRGTPFRVVLRSLGPAEPEAAIRARAAALGVTRQVELRPPLPLPEVIAEAGRASATLVLEAVAAADAWTAGHLSGKFLQLLPLRPPVVFISRPDCEAGDILARTRKGVLCTTVQDIRAALGALLDGRAPQPDPTAVEAYSKVRQGERLLEVMEAVYHRRPILRPADRGVRSSPPGPPVSRSVGPSG